MATEIYRLIGDDESCAYLETGGWTRVEDALPVVPTGEFGVDILVKRDDGTVCREAWRYYETEFGYGITHWRYAEPTSSTKSRT